MGFSTVSIDPSEPLMSATWAGKGFTSLPAPLTAEFASARLVSMFSSAETIPTRKPTTTSTTRTPIATQVHIHRVSAFAPTARPGAAATADAMFSSLLGRTRRGRHLEALVDASGVTLGGVGLTENVSGVGLDGLDLCQRRVEVRVDLRH